MKLEAFEAQNRYACDICISHLVLFPQNSWTSNRTHSFQLIRLTHPLRWRKCNPFIRQLLGHLFQHIRPYIAGTDTVDATEVDPFHRQTFGEMNKSSF